jgi:hypothetical protein
VEKVHWGPHNLCRISRRTEPSACHAFRQTWSVEHRALKGVLCSFPPSIMHAAGACTQSFSCVSRCVGLVTISTFLDASRLVLGRTSLNLVRLYAWRTCHEWCSSHFFLVRILGSFVHIASRLFSVNTSNMFGTVARRSVQLTSAGCR